MQKSIRREIIEEKCTMTSSRRKLEDCKIGFSEDEQKPLVSKTPKWVLEHLSSGQEPHLSTCIATIRIPTGRSYGSAVNGV
jgi:hypothetical protein